MNAADTLRSAAARLIPHGTDQEKQHIEQVQRLANALADQLDAGTLDPFLRGVKSIAQIEFILTWDDQPLSTWSPGLLNRVVALKLDAATMPYARDALLALDAPVMAIAGGA